VDWLRRLAGIDVEAMATLGLEEVEIIELDPAPRPLRAPGSQPAEQPYLRDRRDPTGIAGIWRAIEGL
jgi:hypothetical protein